MIDTTALSYVNMYGILSSLEEFCDVDPAARQVLAGNAGCRKGFTFAFVVNGGPTRTFRFLKESCSVIDNVVEADAIMYFPNPAAFNAMIEKGKIGVPVKSPVALLGFLAGPFTKLTDRLSEVLRADEKALAADPALYQENTLMTLYVIAGAAAALANHDPISRVSASNTVDGDLLVSVCGLADVTLEVRDHRFTAVKKTTPHPAAVMEFADIDTAHALFSGQLSGIAAVCEGKLNVRGIASMVDNANRILDRVSKYLA